MGNLSGYEEKQKVILTKLNCELDLLPPVFDDYVSYLRGRNKSNTTIYSYLNTLTGCLRTIQQEYYITNTLFYKEIAVSDIEYYFNAKSNLSISTLQSHWSVLNSFFDFLESKSLISYNPMKKIRRPVNNRILRKSSHLSKEELDRLLLTIKQNPTRFIAFRDEVIIKLAISTGLEATDIVNLNTEHIDFTNCEVRVIDKSGERKIPVGSYILDLLGRWIEFRDQYFKGSGTRALFVSSMKKRLSVDAAGNMLYKYCEQAHVPRVTFKDLKATMVYLLARENVSMESIMDFLNISDYLIIAQAYDAAIKEKDVDIRSKINGLFSDPIQGVQGNDQGVQKPNISIQVKPPEYSTYQNGKKGFTIYVNLSNITDKPIKVRVKSCSVYTNGMLRVSDYVYSGYQFDEEFIFPETTRTFGKIWITDSYVRKLLRPGEYLLLCLVEVDQQIEHHIKYTLKGVRESNYWVEESWHIIECNKK